MHTIELTLRTSNVSSWMIFQSAPSSAYLRVPCYIARPGPEQACAGSREGGRCTAPQHRQANTRTLYGRCAGQLLRANGASSSSLSPPTAASPFGPWQRMSSFIRWVIKALHSSPPPSLKTSMQGLQTFSVGSHGCLGLWALGGAGLAPPWLWTSHCVVSPPLQAPAASDATAVQLLSHGSVR